MLPAASSSMTKGLTFRKLLISEFLRAISGFFPEQCTERRRAFKADGIAGMGNGHTVLQISFRSFNPLVG